MELSMLSWYTLFSTPRLDGDRGGRGGAGDWGDGEWDGDAVGEVDDRRIRLRTGSGGGGFRAAIGESL
jgi:hypothetical protein